MAVGEAAAGSLFVVRAPRLDLSLFANGMRAVRSSLPWMTRARPPGGDPVPEERAREPRAQTMEPEGEVAVILPGFNFAPRGSALLDDLGQVDIPASGGSGVIYRFKVPARQEFRLSHLGFGCADEAAVQDLTWTLVVGGHPASFHSQRLAVGSITSPAETALNIIGPTTVEVVGVNNGFADKRFFARVIGWYYNSRLSGRSAA